MGRAVSTGVLLEAADAEWRGRLTAERRWLRVNRTGVPSLTALVTVLVTVVSLGPREPGAAGWALAGGLLSVRERRRLRTADRLLAALGQAHAPGGESTHVGGRPPSA